MSYYYKYNFISPDPLFALIKEELRSYFEAGAVDDTFFPAWMDEILKKLGKATRPILETILTQKDFESKLPPEFYGVREAWLCTELEGAVLFPNAKYDQIFCKVTPEYDACNPCNDCFPDILRVTYKEQHFGPLPQTKLKRIYLLKPGNIQTAQHCDLPCANLNASSPDSYDLRGNKFVTNLRQGIIHLIYYSNYTGEDGYQLIPDNYWIRELVKRYIKLKIFDQLWNQTTDETFNQIDRKKAVYQAQYDEAWIMADVEIKKKDVYEIQRSIKRDTNRLRHYKIR